MLTGDPSVSMGDNSMFYQMLGEFSKHWARIDVVCPKTTDSSERVIHGNVFVHPTGKSLPMQFWGNLRILKKLTGKRKYRLIISNDYGFFHNGIAALMISKVKKIPMISEIMHVEGYPKAANWLEKVYRFNAFVYVSMVKNRVLFFRAINSKQIPRLLQKWGVKKEKILVLPAMYLDLNVFFPKKITKKDIDVLVVARLVPNKGLGVVVKALRKLKKRKGFRCVIVGRGPLRDRLVKKIKDSGLEKNIVLKPGVSDQSELADLYRRSKVLVCASYSEGGPRVTVEAMACGTPVITTPVGMMPEIIKDGENGFLFEWDSNDLAKIISLIVENKELSEKMGKKAWHSIQGFEKREMIKRYALTYRRVIEN